MTTHDAPSDHAVPALASALMHRRGPGELSSWAVTCRVRAQGGDLFAESGYRPAELALAGAAVPLPVRGSLIGAGGVSGLAEEDDHRLVVDSMGAYLTR